MNKGDYEVIEVRERQPWRGWPVLIVSLFSAILCALLVVIVLLALLLNRKENPPTAGIETPIQSALNATLTSVVAQPSEVPAATPTVVTLETFVALTAIAAAETTGPIPTRSIPVPTNTSSPIRTTQPTATPTNVVTLPFSDNFENGIDPSWKRVGGQWNMSNGSLTNAGKLGTIWLGKSNWQNIVLEVDVGGACYFLKSSVLQILVSMQDPQNYIAIDASRCNIGGIYLVREGQSLELAAGGGHGEHYRIELKGQIITVEIDGQKYWSASDEVFSSGSVGFKLDEGQYVDNLLITQEAP